MTIANSAIARGVVVTYPNRKNEPEHEKIVHQQLARRLAVLTGREFAGEYDPAVHDREHCYFVPSGSIVGAERSRDLGITGEQDLFGGVVPYSFVATKAITHPLIREHSRAPKGWSQAFCEQVRDAVLPGYTAFSLEDAREAGLHLLQQGPLRLKPVLATAGRGQVRIDDPVVLDQMLAQVNGGEMNECGLVLEANLEDVTTISVGQVRLGGRIISYHGTQRLTVDNRGEQVYGGSDLVVVDGDFDTLQALDMPDDIHLAIEQAAVYDQAASACFPDFYASRRNYDIARGIGPGGHACSGVLEQSWRIGGASSAEIAALDVFTHNDAPAVVRASSLELYGYGRQLPTNATVLFSGEDAEVGYISKSVVVEDYGRT
ncbi:DUF3182 family protein [Azomonas macrocytogenes]|uniref:Biotin carboxylase n=1 Tax=Azomonas macrocytogenes TaxID=69962 RepID=A0A839T448_AZOMA|nr:DUF3182 family protein [Azomonas macrocytogenes]MBB3104192.1 hypothetical protein [Azomonas macrocytogenes]